MPARARSTLLLLVALALVAAPLRAQNLSPATPADLPAPATTPGAPLPNGPGKMLDIHDVLPPIFHLDPIYLLYLPFLLLALGGLVLLLLRARRTTPAQQAANLYRQTLERLAAARPLLASGPPKPYAVKVSEIIRSYLESRFAQASTRETTLEFLRRMELSAPAELQAHREALRTFLEACDLVKFARYQPSQTDLAHLHDAATQFVVATKTIPVSATTTSAPEPAYV